MSKEPGTSVTQLVDEQAGSEAAPPDAPTPKKKRKSDDLGGTMGSAKAVETMFRNAIRAELDMIALAATKANIMISLNGFIISALMISGALLFNSSPSFLIPAAAFMLTSAGSIAFALLAASPERSATLTSVGAWLRDVLRGEARVRDMRDYVLRSRNRPSEGEHLNLLIYEDRARLDPDDFWDRMRELLLNRDEIYKAMSEHLYWLGDMANRKFKLLNISYAIFRWGLVAVIALFLGIKGTLWAFPSLAGQQSARVPSLGIHQFEEVYEPSAVQQLPDGRILVVEDEATRAINVLTIADDGTLVEDTAADLKLTRGMGRKLNDLEGLSVDDRDNIYAITSHAGDKDGKRSPDREQLLRFQVKGSSVGQVAAYTGLRDALAADPRLADAVRAATGETPDFTALNIEGLAYYRETQHLLLGLREPMADGRSLIVPIDNPDQVFEGTAEPRFGAPVALDLHGGGIRALSYDPVLSAFVLVNEVDDAGGEKVSQIWTWSGAADEAPVPLDLPDLIDLNNVESVDSVTVGGEDRLLIMSDEGDPAKEIPAKYMMLDYTQLASASASPEPSEPAEGSGQGETPATGGATTAD